MSTTNRDIKPFGLLFEEKAMQGVKLPAPIYDFESSLSYIKNKEGRQIPFVEMKSYSTTETLTEAGKESTSEDKPKSFFFSTETVTAVQTESTEEDRSGAYPVNDIVLSTETATKADNEGTDRD